MSAQIAILEAAYEAQVAENMRLMEILRSRKAIGHIVVDSENQISFTPLDGAIFPHGVSYVFSMQDDFEE